MASIEKPTEARDKPGYELNTRLFALSQEIGESMLAYSKRTIKLCNKIHLKPDAPIVHVRQFRLSETMRRNVIYETKELEKQNVITRSTSPFNSPAFTVAKKL